MSNCCPSNGAAWDTPVPAPTVLVPAGTQVLATPTAYGACGCAGSSGAASGVGDGSAAPAVAADLSVYPLLKQAAEVPAAGGIFQVLSSGASRWAVAGMQIWFPPFGYGLITGVTGDLIAVKNLTLPPGTVLQSGSMLLATPPPLPVDIPEVEIPTLSGFFKFLTPRASLYSQTRQGGAAWSQDTVTQDLRNFQYYDDSYKAVMITAEIIGYGLSRSFDLSIEINDIAYVRAALGQPNSGDADQNQIIIPIPASKIIKIAAKEFTAASGTYGAMYGKVHLDAFVP